MKKIFLSITVFSLIFSTAFAISPNDAEVNIIVKSVYDGDTFTVEIDGEEEKVRIIGIDAPEKEKSSSKESCEGEKVAQFTKRLLEGKEVILVRDKTADNRDAFGRLLRYVKYRGQDFGLIMLATGKAKVYQDEVFEKKSLYERIEKVIKKREKGIWSKECMMENVKKSEEKTDDKKFTYDISKISLELIGAHPDAKGNDKYSLNDEYLIFKNTGNEAIVLTVFTLHDAQNHEYIFSDFTIESGKKFTIYTGKGNDSQVEIFMNYDNPVWNNAGDTATIKTPNNEEVLKVSF